MDPKRKADRYHPKHNPDGVLQPEILATWNIAKTFNILDERTIIRQRDRYLTDLMLCEATHNTLEAERWERVRSGDYSSPEDTARDRKVFNRSQGGSVPAEALDLLYGDD